MVGTATIALEILEQHPAPDAIVVPVGNGALINGIASYVKQMVPGCRVIGVVAEAAPSMYDSFLQGSPVNSDRMETFAEGIAVRIPVPSAVDYMVNLVDEVVLVSDAEMEQAIIALIDNCHVLVEPSGAAPLAAVPKLEEELQGQEVVLVLTGSNISRDQLQDILHKA